MGDGEIVSNISSESELEHGLCADAVSVRVTNPADISPALGVYIGIKVVLLVKLPVPLVVHNKSR